MGGEVESQLRLAAELAIVRPSDARARPPSALAVSERTLAMRDPFGPVKQVDAGDLNVGYIDAGPADGRAVLLRVPSRSASDAGRKQSWRRTAERRIPGG